MSRPQRSTRSVSAALRALADRLDQAPDTDVAPVALILGMQATQGHPTAARRRAVDVLAAALGLPAATVESNYGTGQLTVAGVGVSAYTALSDVGDPPEGRACRHPSWCCSATLDDGSTPARG